MNYDLLDLDSASADLFKDEMFSFSFYPIINHPTRICDDSATCIDHIWTNVKDRQITSGIFTDEIADHLPTFQISDFGDTSTKTENKSFLSPRDLKKLNALLLNVDINHEISNKSIDDSVHIITNHIFQTMNSIEKICSKGKKTR